MRGGHLRSGNISSCGACATSLIDITGQRFGRLLVLERASARGVKPVRWLVRCDCGTEKTVVSARLRSGETRSCGCLYRELTGDRFRTHGGVGTPEYKAWAAMIARCTRPSTPHFEYYGGRGIRVCAEWRHDFAAFLAHVGPKPGPGYSLDRINVNGHYEPGNVRWATRSQQMRNRRPFAIGRRAP